MLLCRLTGDRRASHRRGGRAGLTGSAAARAHLGAAEAVGVSAVLAAIALHVCERTRAPPPHAPPSAAQSARREGSRGGLRRPGPRPAGAPALPTGAGLPAHGPPTAHPASPCAGRRDRLPGPPRQASSPGSRSPACRPSAPPQLSSCRLCHQCPLDRETTEAVTEQDTSESERGGGCERDAEATGADRHVPHVTASI